MYLKRIELHGFKSFADKIRVELEQGITGVVGPNGCGKSNISDAIRWVLGEQSVKSLRGANMSDVIFAGSQDRKAQNVAEVTLVFDNSDHHMNIAYDEVEITRRLYRQNNEAEYLLNKQSCRLKDIVDLIMDTGLGRDSLSIISQGNISSFADSKPDERRALFEEAAGVSKYKKRKLASIRKLERTKENLDRIGDIVNELEKQVAPLKRQKEKAEKYLTLKEQLTSIEVSVLVMEITQSKETLDKLNELIKDLEDKKVSIDSSMLLKETENEEVKKQMFILDTEVNSLQTKLFDVMKVVNNLETTKVEIDQKRKYLLENNNANDLQEQIKQLNDVLSDAILEYNDRNQRLKDANNEIIEMKENQQSVNSTINTNKEKIEQLSSLISRNKSKKEILSEAIENKDNLSYGIKAILKMAKSTKGILGVVEDLIIPTTEYQTAISVALGGAMQFMITENEIIAKNAISFLRENRAGRVTFLPISVMKARNIRDEHLLVAKEIKGFLGIASDYVSYDKKIENIVLNQLGNILICNNLDSANELSKATFGRYKIVTVDGDLVNVGGSLTGGSVKKIQTSHVQKIELDHLIEELSTQEKEYVSLKNNSIKLENTLKEISHSLLQKQISYGQLETIVQQKQERMVSIKSQYESLTDQKLEIDDFTSGNANSKLVEELNSATKLCDDLTEQIKSKRQLRMNFVEENEEIDSVLKEYRSELKDIQENITNYRIEATKKDTNVDNCLMRLNDEYKMTFDFALEQHDDTIDIGNAKDNVVDLRQQIDSLGNVNIDSIEEYINVSERYENLNTQRLDLLQAQDGLLSAIGEMDEIMIEKFSTTFEKINIEFDDVFKNLFGGGKAKLSYSDPDNILETGVDIDIQPPGKAVQNISLFSGGEKALIALACLFAILKVRPVPMCILDEVEAALDIANVERFAKYLRNFADLTQFIVVTHREGMMEECDILYGATMQQKGVTKLVSVKLEEAIELTDNG